MCVDPYSLAFVVLAQIATLPYVDAHNDFNILAVVVFITMLDQPELRMATKN